MKRLLGTLASITVLVGTGYWDNAQTHDEPTLHHLLPPAVADTSYYDNGSPREEKIELGRMLFFDKVLSGNENISCATCHHPNHASADGVALSLGEGAAGLGPDRRPGPTPKDSVHERVPRNSPAVFNLGAREFTRLFHDGRVETDPNGYFEGNFVTPAKWKLPAGLDNVLAAQAMFPVGSPTEMAGQKGENSIADAVSLNNMAGKNGVWEQLAFRLQSIPAYVELFKEAYPEEVQQATDITFVHAANAIAAFETQAFRTDGSPFDHYLRGSRNKMDRDEKRGMALFYGEAQCSSCHAGAFQTDHDFHAIAMPQIGPGKADGRHADYWRASGHEAFLEDFGRGRVTVRPEDDFKFRTPSLRNVELTGPWGHDGAYETLAEVVRHHLNPVAALDAYEPRDTELLPIGRVLELTASGSSLSQSWLSDTRQKGFELRDSWVQNNPELRSRIAQANELPRVELTEQEVDDLVAFLRSLTDPRAKDLAELVPDDVPSGLTIED